MRFIGALSPTIFSVAVAYLAAWHEGRGLLGIARIPLRAAGAVLILSGLMVRIWATWEFWSRGHRVPVPPLVVTGPYRYSRNPLYLGKLAINVGFALASGALRFLAMIPVWWAFLQWVVVPWEERALRRRFGEAYLRYLDETPRWGPIPNLSPKTGVLKRGGDCAGDR